MEDFGINGIRVRGLTQNVRVSDVEPLRRCSDRYFAGDLGIIASRIAAW
jgi:hypothetical protein